MSSAAATTNVTQAPAQQTTGTQTPPATQKGFWCYFNKSVDFISNNSINIRGAFVVKTTGTDAEPADGALKKTAKFFLGTVVMLALLPFALVGYAFLSVKECLCPKKAADETKADAAKTDTKSDTKTDAKLETVKADKADATKADATKADATKADATKADATKADVPNGDGVIVTPPTK